MERRSRLLNWEASMFLSVKMLVFIAFVLVPFVYTFILMFQMGSVLRGFQFVGMENLKTVFSDSLFWLTIRNTALYMAIIIPLVLTVPLAVGLFLSSSVRGIKIYRTIIYIPSLLSIVTTGLIWRVMILPKVGLLDVILNEWLGANILWLGDGNTAIVFIACISLWNSIGFYSILYMAGFNDIPNTLFEAAMIDGANKWDVFWRIKLPLLKPVIQLVLVLVTIYSIQVYDIIYVLTQGGPGTSTYTVMWYIYKNVFSNGSVGYAAAMGVLMLLITLVIAVFYMRATRTEVRNG